MLNEIYNHSSIAQTRKYLDITQDEINSVRKYRNQFGIAIL
jgi:hypothetical protein